LFQIITKTKKAAMSSSSATIADGPNVAAVEKKGLRAINYANLVAYLANVGITYGVGVSGLFPTNAQVSAKYQTLVTPAGYAFSIWGVIFLSQLVWAILQILPRFQNSNSVVLGVGYWYVVTCVAQSAWSVTFSREYIFASFGAMLVILASLVVIVMKLC